MVRLDAAREIDGKRKRMLTPSMIVLHLNIGDPARLFVTNKIQASLYPIHCNAILLAVGAIMSAIFAKKKGSSSGAKLPPIWRTSSRPSVGAQIVPSHYEITFGPRVYVCLLRIPYHAFELRQPIEYVTRIRAGIFVEDVEVARPRS